MAELKQNNNGEWVAAKPVQFDASNKMLVDEMLKDVHQLAIAIDRNDKTEQVECLKDIYIGLLAIKKRFGE